MPAVAGPNPLEFVLLLLLGGSFGSPGGVPPTAEDPLAAKVAPADGLFYLSWAGTGTPDPQSGNHTEQMLAEPEIQAFLKRAGGLMDMVQPFGPGANSPETAATLADAKKLLALVQGKPGAIYVDQVQFTGDGPPVIKGGGLLRVDGDGPALKALIEKFQNKAAEEGQAKVTAVKVYNRDFTQVQLGDDPSIPAMTWGLTGKYLIIGVGDQAAEELM